MEDRTDGGADRDAAEHRADTGAEPRAGRGPRRPRFALDTGPLRNRGFRAVFVARTVAMFGLGFLLVAVPLQVLALTGSAAQVAAVSATVGVSAFAGTLVGGVLADRVDRRLVILLARAGAGLGFAALLVNALAPTPALWVLYLCGVVDGVCGGVSSTALMAATPGLVPREELAAAGALMTTMVAVGTVTSPALGGLLVAATGFAGNYAVCVATAVVTVGSLLRLPRLPPPRTGQTIVASLGSGFRFAVRDARVGPVLALGLVTMAMAGWTVLVPVVAVDVLGGGPGLVGVLMAAPAAGSLLGSLTSGWTGTAVRIGPVLLVVTLVSTAGLALAGLTTSAVVAVIGLVAAGFGRGLGDIVRYAAVLESTPAELHGRVSAVWTAQMVTATAVGAVVAGTVASVLPLRWALAGYGALGCLLVLLAALVPALRRLRR